MDRSQYTQTLLDELRLIQYEARQTHSLNDLRHHYERVQSLRRTYADDFDVQLQIADVQEELIERARRVREESGQAGATERSSAREAMPDPQAGEAAGEEGAEFRPDAQRLDTKTWQRATYLALFFTLIICAAFFYLIQTARKINLSPPETTAGSRNAGGGNGKNAPVQNAANAPIPASTNPALRLYTDLIPGTVSIDGGEEQDLKDGELTLDNLQPGRHSIKVTGRSGNAEFSFDVTEKTAPRVVGLPTASNAMAVLVSAQDGAGRLVTNADHATVTLDGVAAGEVGTDGLALTNLAKADHDILVTQANDRQRFVLTYTPTPALTVYVKSDPNAGTVVVMSGQDGVDVYVDDKLWRRKTDRGQLRIPLKVGSYTIRVHKAGFLDPPPEKVDVKKAEESAIEFRMQPVPDIATLEIKSALPGTMVYVDKDVAASIGPDGNATISNVKPGDHTIELRRDQALPKKFARTFRTGEVVVLSGPDVTLDKVVVPETKPAPAVADTSAAPSTAAPANNMEVEGEQVRKGGGFIPYHVPKVPGRYSFQAQARRSGLFKRGKIQWFAGYRDPENYILFVLDGKRATVRQVKAGRGTDIGRIPFDVDANEWVQVDVSVKANAINARVKTQGSGWSELPAVTSNGSDFTQEKMGFYIPGNDEMAVANFRFAGR